MQGNASLTTSPETKHNYVDSKEGWFLVKSLFTWIYEGNGLDRETERKYPAQLKSDLSSGRSLVRHTHTQRKYPAPLKSDHSSGRSLNRGSTVELWNRMMFVCVCVFVCVT